MNRVRRVVVDTNVYISALVFGGIPRAVLELAEEQVFTLAVSWPIQREVERILREKFGWTDERAVATCQKIWKVSLVVTPSQGQVVTVCPDPDDNRILECALAARVNVIVSGDHHLLDLEEFERIPIVTPRQFLDRHFSAER